MSNQVIVVLDREAAETLTANPMSHAEGCAGPGRAGIVTVEPPTKAERE